MDKERLQILLKQISIKLHNISAKKKIWSKFST